MRTIIRAIKNPKLIVLYVLKLRLFRILSDKTYLKIKYYLEMGKRLNIDNPKSFNEKLQWLKINDQNPNYSYMVDKLKVREYISNKIGKEYLIPLIGVYNDYDEIDFDSLPNQFVLKPNHTSGDIFICKNKSEINHKKLKKMIKKWLKTEYYWKHREWPYKNVKPKIICEKFLVERPGLPLKDYKFMCFNGEPKCILVCCDRHTKSGLKMDFYNLEWDRLPFKRRHPNCENIISRPRTFELMIKFAKILSNEISFVRVDFYEVNGKLYFGELTFYPGSGFEKFEPEEYDMIVGSWLKLPKN